MDVNEGDSIVGGIESIEREERKHSRSIVHDGKQTLRDITAESVVAWCGTGFCRR